MTLIEILVIVACSLIVLGVIVLTIINKKKGKTSCGCDCANCAGCAHKKKQQDNTQK